MAWKLSFPLCLALVSVYGLDLAIAVLLPELTLKFVLVHRLCSLLVAVCFGSFVAFGNKSYCVNIVFLSGGKIKVCL